MTDLRDWFSLRGEVALVTGASRGIGAAVADALAAAGAKVIGTATSADGAEQISQRLAPAGGRGVVLDVADAGQVSAVESAITARDGVVTVVINNAGITRDNLLLRMKDDEWETVLRTNLTGSFYVCRAFMRGMLKQRRGRIVNISSVVGAMGNAGQGNYAATKAGIVGLTKSLAREVASRGITVNAIAPGFIETDMTAGLAEAQRAELTRQIPLQRLGTADDVAAAVIFLASPAGGYITGETLHVNGGMLMS